jgi:hypothetical protein
MCYHYSKVKLASIFSSGKFDPVGNAGSKATYHLHFNEPIVKSVKENKNMQE